MASESFDSILAWMCVEAERLLESQVSPASLAYQAMANEPKHLQCWWEGAFEKDEKEAALLRSAALAIAHDKPLPELSIEQRARLALRLRLGTRILRALSSKHTTSTTGWFPTKLRNLSKPELLEWLLVDAWPICADLLDGVLEWASEFEHPIAPSSKRPDKSISSDNSSSFSA